MVKKFIKAIAIVLVISLLLPQAFMMASAAKTPSIIVSTVEAKPGDTVNVKIDMANNPGFISALLTVSYDSSALTLTKVTDGDILGDAYHSDNYKSPYTLCWANDTATSNIKKNGTIVTLTFKVSNSAKTGNYLISVSYDNENYDIIDKDLNPVSFTVTNGDVKVNGGSNNDNNNSTFSIKEPSTTKIKYKNGIVLHAQYNGTFPSGSTVKWTADNENFSMTTSLDGKSCTIISESKGTTTFTATLYDKNGDIIAMDTVQMQSKAGILQKIGAFFRELFGWTKILQD